MDAVGSAIRVDTRGREVMRILPRNNDAVNEEWISDKTRFACDGLQDAAARPALRARGRQAAPGELGRGAGRWSAAKLKAATPERIGAIAGDLAGAEEMFALKDLLDAPRRRRASIAARTAPSSIRRSGRASYLFNSTIDGIEQADAILLVGTNPRLEAAVLNARIRKRWRQGGLKVGVIGEQRAAHLSLRVSRRRPRDARRPRRGQAFVRRGPEGGAATRW